jgi:hypothetical protein
MTPAMGGAWQGHGCPFCGSGHVSKAGFTWWGGILGPIILNHHNCHSCGQSFNGRTGKSNNTAIAIYFGVVFAIVIGFFGLRVVIGIL